MPRIALGLLAACVACSVTPTAPGAVAVEHDPMQFDSLTLRWMPPTGGDLNAYAIERRILPGEFETIGTTPSGSTSFLYLIPPSTPELTDLELRVRALPDDDGSRASAAVPFRRGVRPPVLSCADGTTYILCHPVKGAFALALENRSSVADGLLLERGVRLSRDEEPTWTPIPLPATAATFVDADGAAEWFDGARFEYRLSAVKGGERSSADRLYTMSAPPFAPRVVSVSAVGGAVELTVENTSRVALSLDLYRDDWSGYPVGVRVTSASPPPQGETTVLRDALPSSTRVFYDVRTYSPWFDRADGWAIWPAPPTDLAVSTVGMPGANAAVRTGPGPSFATATLASGDPFSLDAASGPPIDVAADGWLGDPGLALDPLGQPHAVYSLGASGPTSLVHAWHDGEIWHVEDVGSAAATAPVAFDVGLDGTVLACWLTGGSEVAVARRSQSGWSVERVAYSQSVSAGPLVAGDAAGVVHVFLAHWTGTGEHLVRDTAGAWSSEPVPTVAGPAALIARPAGVALAGASAGSAWVLERTAAGWGAVEPLGAIGTTDRVVAARSPDGSRFAVASTGGKLWVRDAAGTVAHAFTPRYGVEAGFRADGRAWVLAGLRGDASSSTPTYPCALYEEP